MIVSLSNFVIPSKCLKNFICAASKRRSSIFFSTQDSLPNFSAALAVIDLISPVQFLCVNHRLYVRVMAYASSFKINLGVIMVLSNVEGRCGGVCYAGPLSLPRVNK